MATFLGGRTDWLPYSPLVDKNGFITDEWRQFFTRPNVSFIQAQQTTIQAVPNATFTTLNNFTESLDDANNFNPTTGVFTAPETGFYFLGGSVLWGSAMTSTLAVRFLVNGVTVQFQFNGDGQTDANASQVSAFGLLNLNAGDTVVFQAYQQTGAPKNTAVNQSYFTIFQVA